MVTFSRDSTRININTGTTPISGSLIGGAGSILRIGNSGSVNFTTGNTISNVENISTVTSGTQFTIANAISGVTGSFAVASGTTATFNAALTGTGGTFTNNGTTVVGAGGSIGTTGAFSNTNAFNIISGGSFTVPSGASNTGTISTAGTGILNVENPLSGIVTNAGTTDVSSTLTPAAGSSNSGSMAIASSGTVTFSNPFTNTNPGTIVNQGIMSVNATLTSSGNISTSNRLNLNSDILMSGGATLTNTGAVYVSGNRSLSAGNFTSSNNTQYFTITNAAVYDSITTSGAINVDNDTINVSSVYTGPINVTEEWPILTGASISNAGTTVNMPASNLFNSWLSSFSSTQLIISHTRSNFVGLADPGINTIIAQILDDMSLNITNSGQQALINAFGGYSNEQDYNYGLQQLVPNINAIAPNVHVANYTYDLVESRIVAAQQNIEDPELSGIATGSICPNTTFWLAGFGGAANQQTTSETLGYKARALGAMLGLDLHAYNDDIYGFGFAFSNTEVTESLNSTSETRILGYHALLYGTNYFYGNNFVEWMFTGVKNQNKGGRQIFINNNDFSTNAYFNSWMGGARFNIGKNIDFDNLRLSQVNTMQYSYLYQSSYNEVYSPAALHVAEIEDNLLTIGSGARVIWHPDSSTWLHASPAIHAMLTYDVISSAQAVNASFIVGSNNFTIIQSPARVAARFGLDLTAEICDRLQLQISYDLELRSKYIDNSGELKLLYLF